MGHYYLKVENYIKNVKIHIIHTSAKMNATLFKINAQVTGSSMSFLRKQMTILFCFLNGIIQCMIGVEILHVNKQHAYENNIN